MAMCISDQSLAGNRTSFYYQEENYTQAYVKICVDDNFWFPYTFSHKGKPVGLHADIVDEALKELTIQAKYVLSAWDKCLQHAQEGKIDALVSVSYTPEREAFIYYPEDAAHQTVSAERIGQVVYYAVTAAKDMRGNLDTYRFQGDIKTLPKPIRIESGYSIEDFFKAEGISVKSGRSSVANMQDLLRSRNGSVITVYETIQAMQKKGEFRGELQVHRQPIQSKSYFMGFSKRTNMPGSTQRVIWKKIQEVRDNDLKTAVFLKRYGF